MSTSEPALRGLGAFLRDVGFDEHGIETTLGGLLPRTSAGGRVIGVRRLASRPGPLADAIALWYLGADLPPDRALAASGGVDLALLAKTRLLAPARAGQSGLARPAVRIVPFADILVAHDRDDRAAGSGFVLGVGGATRSLAALTIDPTRARFLDLGTGSGSQALLAARRGDRVVATDLNRRAIRLARVNALLNDMADRIELRVGDLYAPVYGEQFDAIASNPPFVVSPDHAFIFRDGARPGDAMSRVVVQGAAEHLAEGGFATVLVNWLADENGTGRVPEDWLDGLGCDAIVLHHETTDVLTYAARWIVRRSEGGDRAYETTLDRWLRYYDEIGATAIASGAMLLRRRQGATNWIRAEVMHNAPGAAGGRQIERMFEAYRRFAPDDDGIDGPIGAAVFRLVDGHRLEQHLPFEEGAYHPHEATLRIADGAGVDAKVPPDALEALFAIDGARPLGAIVSELAEAREQDLAEVAAQVVPAIRTAYEAGILTLS